MSSQPLVSVCIPCYNGARFIGETIKAVLSQSLTNFELVIVDDNSTDATVQIVETFIDPRIRFHRNAVNSGMGGNWNRVLSLGLGKYVKLLCEDDLIRPDCLGRQVAILEDKRHSGIALTVCNREVINSSGDVVLSRRRCTRAGTVKGRSLVLECLRRGSNVIGEPAVGLFRKEALARQEICDPTNPYLSDLSLWTEVLKYGDAFVDSSVLASFRISSGAATTGIGLRQASYFRRFAKQLQADPFYRASGTDLVRAYLLSYMWCLVRNVFVRYQIGQPSRTSETAQMATGSLIPNQCHANRS